MPDLSHLDDLADNVLLSPGGRPLRGTLESLNGVALAKITWTDAKANIDHEGYTDIYHESQETVERSGQIIVVDDQGDEWPLAQCVTVADWRTSHEPEPRYSVELTAKPTQGLWYSVQDKKRSRIVAYFKGKGAAEHFASTRNTSPSDA